jgi:hypothetical protein
MPKRVLTEQYWEDFGLKVLQASRKNKGQIVIHQIAIIGEVIVELHARKDKVLDFDKRARGTPLEISSGV